MGEHVGERNFPTYVDALRRAVEPGGPVLVQMMSRPGRNGGRYPGGGPFIESFIAPDMHMRPVGETVAYLEAGGLEVRDVHGLREHYVRTVAGWLENFEANLDRLTDLVGEEAVRVWRLYLVGGSMAFRDGRMGVDQILCVRPGGSAPGASRCARGDRSASPALVLLVCAVAMTITALVARRLGRVSVVDVTWGLPPGRGRADLRAAAPTRTPGGRGCWPRSSRSGAAGSRGTSTGGRRATARTRGTRSCSAARSTRATSGSRSARSSRSRASPSGWSPCP